MSKGIVRAIDKMGRVVIPKEYRKQLNMENDVDSFEISLVNDSIVLRKHQPFCVFCNKLSASVKIGGYAVCTNCIDRLNEARKHLK